MGIIIVAVKWGSHANFEIKEVVCDKEQLVDLKELGNCAPGWCLKNSFSFPRIPRQCLSYRKKKVHSPKRESGTKISATQPGISRSAVPVHDLVSRTSKTVESLLIVLGRV
jgi:hypothetical protein